MRFKKEKKRNGLLCVRDTTLAFRAKFISQRVKKRK